MKKIGDGIYVEEHDGYRSYIVEADYEEHMAAFKLQASESNAPAEEILKFIRERDHIAELGGDEMIFLETEQPTKLVKDLCDGNYINTDQATVIMMHEIEHITNADMKESVRTGGSHIREYREVVIQYKINPERRIAKK